MNAAIPTGSEKEGAVLVSVVVPAYNEEKYIRSCLEALDDQEHPGFEYEVIVVDDGSTDRTAAIALEYGARLLSGPRRGVAGARQAGFEAAQGTIIASTDADSTPPRDWLRRLVTELENAPQSVGVYGPFTFSDGKWYENWGTQYIGGFYFWLTSMMRVPNFSGQNFAVWREAWNAVGGFDPSWRSCEDSQLSLKLARVGQVRFRWDIVVPTSSRRTREGYACLAGRSIANHVRVMWLGAPPLPFSDIR